MVRSGSPASRLARTCIATSVVLLFLTGAKAASAAPGQAVNQPSTAPVVTLGQTYFGNTKSPSALGDDYVDWYRLPPLLAEDVVTVQWKGPGKICLTGDVNDFSAQDNLCNLMNGNYEGGTSSSGTQSELQAARAAQLAYFNLGQLCCTYQGGAYQFDIPQIQHQIGVTLTVRESLG